MSLLELDCHLAYASGFVVDAKLRSDTRVTGLFGPSGSGKSSILSMIAGLRTPQHGIIRVGTAVLFDSARGINLKPEARHIGYVLQQHLLFPHLSIRDNLLYGWRRRAEPTTGIEPERVLRVLDLEPLLDRRPATLSGGQRQRVALGRALLRTPALLLLDEPLASFDDELRQQVMHFVERVLGEWQIPTLYVTHDAAEARQLCQHIIYVRDGRVVDPTP